jgi:hypothetical protein
VFFEVGVSDVDAGYKRAVDNRAVPAMPPTDMFWGDRYGWLCRTRLGICGLFAPFRRCLSPTRSSQNARALLR